MTIPTTAEAFMVFARSDKWYIKSNGDTGYLPGALGDKMPIPARLWLR